MDPAQESANQRAVEATSSLANTGALRSRALAADHVRSDNGQEFTERERSITEVRLLDIIESDVPDLTGTFQTLSFADSPPSSTDDSHSADRTSPSPEVRRHAYLRRLSTSSGFQEK